jgi:hypothetical protein
MPEIIDKINVGAQQIQSSVTTLAVTVAVLALLVLGVLVMVTRNQNRSAAITGVLYVCIGIVFVAGITGIVTWLQGL